MTRRRAAGFAVGAAAVAGYLAVTRFGLGGERAMVAVEDLGEALAAVVAAVACAIAARRGGAAQRAWVFFAASSAVWALGETVWSVYEVGLGVGVPFPSLADVGFLASIPLGVAAILALPTSPRTLNGALRLVVDSAMVASALIFVGWGVGLSELYGQAAIEQQGRFLVLAYPAGDIVILTMLAAAMPGSGRPLRASVGVLCLAFLVMLIADGSFAYLMLRGDYGVLGGSGDVGWIAGFGLLAAAATLSSGKSLSAARVNGDREMRLWQFGIPWLGAFAVIVATLWMSTSGRVLGPAFDYIGTTVGVLFVASQALAVADSALLLRRSRRAEAQLRERTSLMAEVIARAPLGIARIDAELRFIDANPRLGEMLMVPARLLAGAPLAQFLTEDEMERVHDRAGRMQSGHLEHVEVDSEMLVGGQKLFVHRTVTPVLDDAGTFRYFLVMFEDVTAKHEHEQAALANLVALERLSRLKSEFMSMVSHEFRTALTGIQGFSELMSSEEVAPVEVKEFAGDINADALRLNRMITEMLDLDRIESGRMAMHMAPVDLNRLLNDAVERARMTTEKHDIVIALDSAMPMVLGDADRLTQVVTNLLSNAIKYSPEGGQIVVSSRLDGLNAEVSIRDHGQGIPPEFITRIFGRYERYDGGKNQPVGTGLGLAITQQILQLHNGRIWVESTPGQGSDFKFALPIAVKAPVETR